jgi:hypothetical protein
LLLARNRIGQLRVGGDLVIRLRDLSTDTATAGLVMGLFRTARLTDNVFALGENVLVCLEATLSGNRFGPPALGQNRHAIIVGNAAFYFGNHGLSGESRPVKNVAPRSNAQTRADLNSVIIQDA